MDVCVVGSCVQDLASYCERFPQPGESVRGSKFMASCGGKGANQAVIASKLGAKAAMVTKVGDDIFGPSTIENFKKYGVNTDCISVSKEQCTGTATVMVDANGQNSIVVILGANMVITADDVQKAEAVISKSKVLTCQLEIPIEATLESLKLARKHGVASIFNPAPGLPNLPEELYKFSDIVCPNENEAEIITGNSPSDPDFVKKVLKWLIERGAKHAVLTLGKKGVSFQSGGSDVINHVDAPVVKAVDTTGAGDAFVGSLAYFTALRPDLSLEERIKRSCRIASHSVQFHGTQLSYPTRQQLPEDLFA